MHTYTDTILYQTRQHGIVLFVRFIRNFMIAGIPMIILGYILADSSMILVLVVVGVAILSVFAWTYFFWSKSYFIITNKKISIKVRNGIFSKYHMSLYYKNIKDIAYSKNNVFHYLFDCGSFFARSSAGSVGDFEGPWLPEIEKIYQYVNNISILSESYRDAMTHLETTPHIAPTASKKESLEACIAKEVAVLRAIPGIKEVISLSAADRRYIFEHEEDRNHGVYESLRKTVLLALTHDATFRDPDEAIVFQKGEKVIFPTVGFHEVQRPGVVSASPGIEIHEYLLSKFQRHDPDDATILIGFEI